MKFINWISDKVATRIATIIGGLIVSKVEAEAIHAHSSLLDELLNEAKRLEASGNPELANKLREKASCICIEKPGQTANEICEFFDDSTFKIGSSKQPASGLIESSEKGTAPSSGKRRGRPKKIKEDGQ